MSQQRTLAFLQNFYTDVTLYVPAEAEAVAEPPILAAPLPPQPAFDAPPAPQLPSLASIPAVAPPLAAPAAAPVASQPLGSPVAPGAPPPAAPAIPPVMLTTFSTLGDNAQGVVLLFRLPAEQFKKLPRNVFLNKMLQALDLVMADVVLVNVESHLPVALSNLRREISAGRVLAFGRNLLDVAVRTTQIYEPVQFIPLNLSYLAAAEVELIEYDNSLKKRLWGGLQRMFLA